jgi:hypothetical protein
MVIIFAQNYYHHFNIWFTTMARVWKGAGRECNPGVRESVREWAHTLPNGFPLWELESLWIPKFSKNNLRGKNSLDWRVLYTIGKMLKHRCLKWAYMIHLNTCNTSGGPKKSWELNYQFDFQPLKVKNHPKLCACRWHATYCLKVLDHGYNFVWDFILIESLHKKFWASKLVGVLILGISSREKWHLNVAHVANHREYCKGEGGGVPQVWAIVSLVSPCIHMAHLCTKSVLTMH